MDKLELRELIWSTLCQNSFLLVNRKLYRKIGLIPGCFLSLLIDKERYHNKNESLKEDDFFYETIESMETETSLTRYEQDIYIKKLLSLNLIETKLAGLPARRHFKIRYDTIQDILKAVCKETANCEIPDTYEKTSEESNGTDCKTTANLFVADLQQTKTDKENSSIDTTSLCNTSNSVVCEPVKKTIKLRTTPLVIIPENPDKPDFTGLKPLIRVNRPQSHPKVTEEMKQILAHWQSKGFRRSIPGEDTNSYSDLVRFLQDLFDGILFVGFKDRGVVRKYSVREVKLSIDNFWLAVFDKNYLPFNKAYVETMSITEFIYNRREVHEERKSPFLEYLSLPRRVTESKKLTAIDTLPAVTQRLEEWFMTTFGTVGIDGNFKRNDLIFTSRCLDTFYKNNKGKLTYMEDHYSAFNIYEPVNFLAKQLTRMFDKMLRENDGLFKLITTEWLKSPKTMEERLPAFLKSERMMS